MFTDFKKVTKKEWLAKVVKDLKGKPLEGLNWQLAGQDYTPFFHAEDIHQAIPIIDKKRDNHWGIGEKIIVTDYQKANIQALAALEKGANTLCFDFKESPTIQNFSTLAKGVHFDWITTQFTNVSPIFIQVFQQFLSTSGIAIEDVACAFSLTEFDVKALANWQKHFPKAQFLTVNGIPAHEGNKHTVQELAYCITQGNELLQKLVKADLFLNDYYQSIQFYLTLGGNYFLDIAKIRALKILWNQVLAAWDKHIDGYPSIQVFLTQQDQITDEHYHKIITSTQAMSAVIGGANQLFITPSDAFKNSDGTTFSRRIALNVQHLLQQESYLDRVKDPAAGSYFIETLTNDLAEEAWKIFQNLQ